MSKPSKYWPYLKSIAELCTIPGTNIGLKFLTQLQDDLADADDRRELTDLLTKIHRSTRDIVAELADAKLDVSAEQLQAAAVEIAEQVYRADLATSLRRVEFRGIRQMEQIIKMDLDDLFVNLKIVQTGESRWRMQDHRVDPDEIQEPDGSKNPDNKQSMPAERFDVLLDRPGFSVILGGPGSGKTTMLKRVARALASGGATQSKLLPRFRGSFFPVRVPVGTLVALKNASGIFEAIQMHVAAVGGDALKQAFLDHWAAGTCILLLDGLDEIPSVEARIGASRALDDLAKELGTNRLIVTSRVVGYDICAVQSAAAHATIQPFERPDIEAFVRNWYNAFYSGNGKLGVGSLAKQDADALLADIRRSDRVESLASNPLMLTIIALIKHQSIQLPERRVELYDIIVETLMRSWHKARSIADLPRNEPDGSRPTVGDDLKVWAAVAFWMHDEKGRLVSRTALHQKLTTIIEDFGKDDLDAAKLADEYIGTASEQFGLLEQTGQDEFSFLHQTFQEYLAAQHLVRQKPRAAATDRILARVHDPRWTEVIRLAAGFIGIKLGEEEEVDGLIRGFIDRDDPLEPFIGLGPRLACACIADDVGVSRDVAAQAVRALCGWCLAAESTSRNRVCAMLLRSMRRYAPTGVGIDGLVKLSAAADWQTRMEVARMLGRSRSTSTSDPCLERLLNDPDPDVCAHAAAALLPRASPQRVERLAATIVQGNQFLAEFPPGGPVGAAAPAVRLLGHSNADVSVAAADALGKWGPQPDALAPLIDALRSDDSNLRFAAAGALGEWGPQPDALAPLIDALRSENSDFRHAAADVLGNWGPQPDALAPLIDALRSDDSNLRFAAANALGNWGPQPDALTPLIDALRSDNPDLRRAAAYALGKWGPQPDALAPLIDALRSDNPDLRRVAADALGKWGPQPDALAPLIDALRSDNPDLRSVAAYALGKWGPQPDALAPLINALRSDNPDFRRAAADALGKWGPQPDALAPLIDALRSDNPALRRAAANALGKWGPQPDALAPLFDALRSDDSTLQFATANALGNWGPQPDALAPLIDALRSDKLNLRSAAASVLGDWGRRSETAVRAVLDRLTYKPSDSAVAFLANRLRGRRTAYSREIAQSLADAATARADDSDPIAEARNLLNQWIWSAFGGAFGS